MFSTSAVGDTKVCFRHQCVLTTMMLDRRAQNIPFLVRKNEAFIYLPTCMAINCNMLSGAADICDAIP